MSLSVLADAMTSARFRLLSTDLFDTVLLRDSTTETQRLALVGQRASAALGTRPDVLTRLRWSFHDSAYRAVAMERPEGDASLVSISHAMAAVLGLGDDAARTLQRAEVDIDIEHLRPNRPLLKLLETAAGEGARIIAVSDTYYSEVDLWRILGAVVGPVPIAAVYSSADVGLTKHAGALFYEVARREKVSGPEILHMGDNEVVDVRMAQAATWSAVHLPRSNRQTVAGFATKARAVPARLRRNR